MINKITSRLKNKYRKLKNDRVVFMSLYGHYSDSPMYLSEEMHRVKPDLEQVWLVKPEYMDNVPDYCKKVVFGSPEAREMYDSAHVLIDNTYCDKERWLTKEMSLIEKLKIIGYLKLNDNKGQKCYSTWHSTSVKKMGIDIRGTNITDFICSKVTMLLDSDFNIDLLRRLTFNKLNYVKIGCPRNDVLYDIDEQKVMETRKKLNLPLDKKIILYAPTFRSDGADRKMNIENSGIRQMNMIDFDELFKTLYQRFGGDWVFVGRFHYHVQQLVDWESINKEHAGKIINGNSHDNMQDYLVASDILVTDASSSIIDFTITGKPSFVFFPDAEHYINEERGMYFELDELPKCAYDFDQLIENIKKFDPEEHKRIIEGIKDKCRFIDNKRSSKDIVSYILKDSGLE